jgi:uncharacterized protein
LTILQVKKYYLGTLLTRTIWGNILMTAPLYSTKTDPPTLIGQRCTSCEWESFPANPYGCEACGADAAALVKSEFAGHGVVRTFTTTVQVKDALDTSFTVGVIELERGLKIRAVLDHAVRDLITPGIKVRAVAASDPMDEAPDLYFTLTSEPAK